MLRRSALALSRRAAATASITPFATRTFATSIAYREQKPSDISTRPADGGSKMIPFDQVRREEDLLAPGSEPGEVPDDYEQSTGLERLEILGKMQGVDIFDMRPLDASRVGTLDDPIVVNSAGDEQFAGCTGCPADSHVVVWLNMSRKRPIERCTECGSVYRMEYIGPTEDTHGDEHGHGHGEDHGHHGYEEPKTFADYVKPEYRGTPKPFYGEGQWIR